jgi:hypothetical protein
MAMLEIDWQPDARRLRQFGLASLGAGLLLAGVALMRGGLATLAAAESWRVVVPLAFGIVSALLALLRPRWLKPLYLGLTALTWPIGWCVSLLVLLLLFFALFLPVALVFRLLGRDAMRRRYDPSASSYWIERPPASPPASYFRQS